MALTRINQTSFQNIVFNATDNLLLCFHTLSTVDEDSLKTIEKVSTCFSKKLSIYLVDEDDLDFFQNTFSFWGTPIYILVRAGQERERLLGKISEETLTKFILRNMNDNKTHSNAKKSATQE